MRKETREELTQSTSRNTPGQYDVEQARNEFYDLIGSLKNKNSLYAQLGEYDEFYLTAVGLIELGNVRRGGASLGPTRRAVDALSQVIEAQEGKSKSLLKRQKIQTLND